MENNSIDIDREVLTNENYRKVIYTDSNVLMSNKVSEYIEMEKHETITQIFHVSSGKGIFTVGRNRYLIGHGQMCIVPPNTYHMVTVVDGDLKLYTSYSKPVHDYDDLQARMTTYEPNLQR